VQEVQQRQRLVLGVFDPTEAPEGKERLRECGVDQVIESDASADEFVVALRALVTLAPAKVGTSFELPIAREISTLTVIGAPPGGCGATEVAVAWAARLARFAPTVLVDVDETAPAVAQRLGLKLLPNLRSAIDVVQHRHGSIEACLQPLGQLGVLPGLSGDRDWMEVRPFEVVDLIGELRQRFRHVVANLGSQLEQIGFGDAGRFGISRAVVEAGGAVVGVGLPSPVSISRLISWSNMVTNLNKRARLTLLINRAPDSLFKRAEIAEEIHRAVDTKVIFIPPDREVEAAAWSGDEVTAGRFVRTVRRLVDESLVK
jgi:MinD-like ATPase involved in chromosome partitioning or flagellar assembly